MVNEEEAKSVLRSIRQEAADVQTEDDVRYLRSKLEFIRKLAKEALDRLDTPT